MKLRYENISYGYLGIRSENTTLNSKYYAEFFDEINKTSSRLTNILTFPQRIPRSGFFDELFQLETDNFKTDFAKLLKTIKSKLNAEVDIRIYINWSNLLLRYGIINEVSNIEFSNNYVGPFALELKIIKETIKIEALLSSDSPISVDGFLELVNLYLHDEAVTDREKVMLLNRVIVYYYRHQKKSCYHDQIVKLSSQLLDLTHKFKDTDFINMLYSSVAYRGLAMVSEFGADLQAFLLIQAEALARDLKGDTKCEKIVASENLYTCLLTLSKWSLITDNFKKAEGHLREMINIDPLDSTAYSELGIVYIKSDQYHQAADQFKKAMELGPPGTGMNAYYYAKCLEALGREKEAIDYLYESAELDKQAISPWLDLLTYFTNNDQVNKAVQIANHLYQTPILKDQLEEDEISLIKNLVK